MGWDGMGLIRFDSAPNEKGMYLYHHLRLQIRRREQQRRQSITSTNGCSDDDRGVFKRHQQLQHAPIRYGFAMQLE